MPPNLTHSIKPFVLTFGCLESCSRMWYAGFFVSCLWRIVFRVLLVEDYTWMSCVYFLKPKSEVFDVLVKFYHIILLHFQTQPQILRSDNRGEYVNLNIKKFISYNSLIHQTTCSDTPQQTRLMNGKIKSFSKLHEFFCLNHMFPLIFCKKPLLLPLTWPTVFPQKLWTSKPFYILSKLTPSFLPLFTSPSFWMCCLCSFPQQTWTSSC